MSRDKLHALIERIPEEELPAAARFLEYLTAGRAWRAAVTAEVDDESVTEADIAAITEASRQVRTGEVVSHDEVLREFGLR